MDWMKGVRDFFLSPTVGPSPTAYPASALAAGTERFGLVTVDASLGDALVAARPYAATTIARVRDLLPDLAREEKTRLVDQVVRRFALYVLDLPASEAAHHARAWGLFDHSLDAALLALERLAQAGRLSPTGDPVKDRRLAPRYRYAAFLCGLLHDVGKICDVVVRASDVVEEWNAFDEPLAAYAKRHGLTGVFGRHRHVAGRGKTRHMVSGPVLLERVAGSAPLDYLRDVLVEVLDSKNRRGDARRTAAHLVADAVALADRADSRRDSEKMELDDAVPEPTVAAPAPEATPAASPVARSESMVELFGRAVDLIGQSSMTNDVFGLEEIVVLAYPAGLVQAMERMRSLWASSDRRVAALTADAAGVRAFAGELAAMGALRLDSPSKAWKHQATVVDDGGSTIMLDVILVDRKLAGRAVPRTDVALRVLSPTDHRPVHGPPTIPLALVVPYDGPAVVKKIREELVGGRLTTNIYRADCYITTDAVYIVRDALERVLRSLGMNANLSETLSSFLTAVGRAPETLRTEKGKVHHWIKTRADSEKPVGAVALKTCAMLTRADLDRFGFYPEEIRVEPPLPPSQRGKFGLTGGVA